MVMFYYQNGTQSLDKNDENTFQILQNMAEDKFNCYQCINNHTNYVDIKKILKAHDGDVEEQLKLSSLCLFLNIFGIFNIIVVFIVYGEPTIINSLTCINAVYILAAPFVKQFNHMIYMESSVIFITTIVTIQSYYCIIIATLEIHVKLSIKTE
jgi:hypothetical protein